MMFGIIGTAIGLSIIAKVAGSACRTLERSCPPQRNNYQQRYSYLRKNYNYRPYYNNRNNNHTHHQNNNHIRPQNNNHNYPYRKKRNEYWKLKVI